MGQYGQQAIGIAGFDQGRLLVGDAGELLGERLLPLEELDEQIRMSCGLEVCHRSFLLETD
jgi:hypothetical protein